MTIINIDSRVLRDAGQNDDVLDVLMMCWTFWPCDHGRRGIDFVFFVLPAGVG